MSPIARCPACIKTYDDCTCVDACAVCGCVTNHSTKCHEDVLAAQEADDGERDRDA